MAITTGFTCADWDNPSADNCGKLHSDIREAMLCGFEHDLKKIAGGNPFGGCRTVLFGAAETVDGVTTLLCDRRNHRGANRLYQLCKERFGIGLLGDDDGFSVPLLRSAIERIRESLNADAGAALGVMEPVKRLSRAASPKPRRKPARKVQRRAA